MSEGNGAAGVVRNEKKIDLALIGSSPMAGGLVPRTLEEALQLVKLLAESELIPPHLRKKPSDVFVIVAKGLELGLKPMHALSELFVVEGKPGCSAALKRALCLTSQVCDYFQLIESSSTKCIYEAKRKGAKDPVRLTKTWDDAIRAKLSTKATYQQHPDAMLRAWCSRALADAEFPDVVQGMRNDDDRELDIGGEVMEIRPNRAPQSVAAPGAVTTVEPTDDAFEAVARGETPEPTTIEDALHERINNATDRDQLKPLVDLIQKEVKNVDLRGDLTKHWTRRFTELDPKKAAPK